MSKAPRPGSRVNGWIAMIIFSLLILPPAFLGFGNKFMEFVTFATSPPESSESGVTDFRFVLPAVMSYLLASLGFFFLLCWSVFQGMFRDIEGPKYDMLEREQEIEKQEKLVTTSESIDGNGY